MHRRARHKASYMEERLETNNPKNVVWTDEEIHLLALKEHRLSKRTTPKKGSRGTGVNQMLAKIHPARTVDSITGMRKTEKYKFALDRVRQSDVSSHEPAGGTSQPQENTPNTWSEALKLMFVSVLLATADLSTIVPGQPSGVSQEMVNEDLEEWLPRTAPRVLREVRVPPLPRNKRLRRRALYARVQKSWRKNRKTTIVSVLSGAWELEAPTIDRTAFVGFWADLFGKESVADPRTVTPIRDTAWSVIDPIEAGDVERSLGKMDYNTAAGPDNRDLEQVRQIPAADLAARFNFWMYSGCIPDPLYEGITSFIPKVSGSQNPADFRPITVSSILVRCFHNILAKRLETLCPPSLRQKAFRSGDGICENIETFKAVLKHAQDPKRPRDLYLTFLDVRKAFDSVSHESIVKAAERAGVPPPLLAYIRNLYQKATTRLKVGGVLSDPVRVGQGVRQGDPLSPILFNFVIDWALAEIDPEMGYKLDVENRDGCQKINHLAFADDMVLLAQSKEGLQRQIDLFSNHLAGSGLFLNPKKCKTIGITVVGQRENHSWVYNTRGFAKVGGIKIDPMPVGDSYKYLGIQVTLGGYHTEAKNKLNADLGNLSRAPLKPQQRLWALNNCVIPSLYHELVLSECTQGSLASLDVDIRTAVRRWTRLPKDTVTPYFYASSRDGGLGIVSLRWTIPQMKVNRLSRLLSSQDPLVGVVAHLNGFTSKIQRWSKASCMQGDFMSCPRIRREVWSRRLYSTVDGRGLEQSSLVPSVHDWVQDGNLLLSGAKFNAALALRGGTLPTRVRASRGRGTGIPDCDHCGVGQKESLGHIVQTCGRTHGARVKRHDRVLAETAKAASKLGYTTLLEPHITTSEGMRKPDLVLFSEERKTAAVVDVTICSDNIEVNRAHFNKVETYERHPEITQYVQAISGGLTPFYSAVAINWRGAISPQSACDLVTLGFNKQTLRLLSVITVEQSAVMHRLFHTSTARRQRVQNHIFDPP